MTVAELIAQLREMPQDAPVCLQTLQEDGNGDAETVEVDQKYRFATVGDAIDHVAMDVVMIKSF